MSARCRVIDREKPMLMPLDLRDWIPENGMCQFMVEVVEKLDLRGFKVNERGSGSEQYQPAMMLSLLIYCYATGRFSSRVIEAATYYDVAVRYICGGDEHPDHDTICAFRRENRALFEESFVQVLEYASEVGGFKKVGSISVDGTKIQANASKHAAVSYKRAGELIAVLEVEVKELLVKAEEANGKNAASGLDIPAEITRREDRKASLEKARQVIAARHEERRRAELAEYEEKLQQREAKKAAGKRVGGKAPQPPPEQPSATAQYNYTDPESRIMKAGSGQRFEQAYNAQAAVDVEGSMLVVGGYVTDAANDKEQLAPAVAAVEPTVRAVTKVLADHGYSSEIQVKTVEQDGGPLVFVATGKEAHHPTITDLLPKADPPPPPATASFKEIMAHRLNTQAGKAHYKLRKQTVEPVFGIIKEVLGFRRFSLRGLAKVNLEWKLVLLAYNCKRLHVLMNRCSVPVEDEKIAKAA